MYGTSGTHSINSIKFNRYLDYVKHDVDMLRSDLMNLMDMDYKLWLLDVNWVFTFIQILLVQGPDTSNIFLKKGDILNSEGGCWQKGWNGGVEVVQVSLRIQFGSLF